MKKWIAVGAALLKDRPWSRENPRPLLFASVVLSGLVAGAVEGGVLCNPVVGASEETGDGYLWDTIAFGAWMGAAAGHAAALALIATRNLVQRAILSGLGGIVFVTGAFILSADGIPQGSWEGYFHEDTLSMLTHPGAWGVYLGGPLAGTIAVVVHLSRRCFGKPRLLCLVAGLSILVGVRAQSFFWDQWITRVPAKVTCYPDVFADFGSFAGIPFALTTMAVLLLVSIAAGRFSHAWLTAGLGAGTAVASLGLSWAVHAMPLAEMSPIENMAFSEDCLSLLTTHRGNALRTWRLESDRDGKALPPRELRRIRLPKGTIWRGGVALHPPFVACIVKDSIHLLEVSRLQRVAKIPLSESWGWLGFTTDGRSLGLCQTKEVLLWELVPNEDSFRCNVVPLPPVSFKSSKIVFPHARSWYLGLDLEAHPTFTTHSIARLSSGVEILASDGERKSYVWNSGLLGSLMTFQPPLGPIHSALLSPDEQLLLLSTEDEQHRILDLRQSRVLIHERQDWGYPRQMAVSADRQWIGIRSGEKELRVWKWPTR